MRLNSKGQVTIPAELRHKHGLVEGDEVDVVEDGDKLRIVRRADAPTRGDRVVSRMRGAGTVAGRTTDELMALLRDD
ncbi:AbrB/MazE/SpoVT family DNA-binding domain-containing protein [Nocardioides sp. LHD-245]|uniref:AbrB/MazE/SpoVT family DNA-binding domain-containing protein n=1 Tax=Nocardioides sp. LHD-245 TaxID=3051387 RepID=UPI0027E11939|nr:AbrB/MazE/SpoVT family DNA-binding domain-containing protein [Nocardioides sp. LHD-245]